MITKNLLAVGAVAMLLAGCNTTEPAGQRQTFGTVAGAVAGGAVGSAFGGGSGRVAAIAGGALVGAVLGNVIGSQLDAADRQAAHNAQYQALETGNDLSWRNPSSGNYGEIVTGPTYTVNNSPCREYTHTVYIGGEAQVARGTACQQGDGSWRIVS